MIECIDTSKEQDDFYIDENTPVVCGNDPFAGPGKIYRRTEDNDDNESREFSEGTGNGASRGFSGTCVDAPNGATDTSH